jgi:tRNA nucleotidyltransferase (CCA-adding enzyme)
MNIPDPVLHVCKTLLASGFEAWLVGGAVRDSLLGREAHDWDIASNATPADVMRIFQDSVPIGGHCGTVAVKVERESYEVTPFRSDGAYTDGRHPDSVRFVATIEEDLARRDFTMNAVAYDPIGERWCDPHAGRGDIERTEIRAVGIAADRFHEDGLRILRGLRFAAALGFKLAGPTGTGMAECRENLRRLAPERVHDELAKTMATERPSTAFQSMADLGLLEQLAPEFLPLLGCEQNRWHAFDVWGHTMRVMDAVPASDPVLRFAGLFHDIAKPATKGVHPVTGDATFYNHEEVGAEMTEGILLRLKFSNEERERIVHHVRHHLIPYEPGWTAASIRRWVRRVGATNVASLCSLGRADLAGKGTELAAGRDATLDELERRIATMTIHQPIATATSQLAISGKDVMDALGIGPGPAVGAKLRELLDLVTERPEENTREGLLAALAAPRAPAATRDAPA